MLKRKLIIAAAPMLLVAVGLHAHCGLNFCPRDADMAGNAFEAGLGAHQTGYSLNGHGGQYTEILPNFTYTYDGKLLLGVDLAFAGLALRDETKWGMENPLLFGEWRFYPGMGNRVSVGVQAELPFGTDENLAADHYMLVPYLSYGKGMDPWFASATLGYRARVSPEKKKDSLATKDDFLYVHPHEDQEILYRVGAGLSLMGKRANPEIYLDGQHVMVDDKESLTEDDDLSLGLNFPFAFNGSMGATPKVEFPLLSTDRFDWTAGVDFRYRF